MQGIRPTDTDINFTTTSRTGLNLSYNRPASILIQSVHEKMARSMTAHVLERMDKSPGISSRLDLEANACLES